MPRSANDNSLGSSFRDPSGEVFKKDGIIYRNIYDSYRDDYRRLMDSGLYQKLAEEKLLIPHTEVSPLSKTVYKTIRPEQVPFISYPYEWCFSQLKDAALATLAVQKIALVYGMSLKDANCYNIQFFRGRPVMIDTLSFEQYRENAPWIAYQQFCTNFLSPLLLMSYKNENLNKMLLPFINGIPLDITSTLLPLKTHLNPGVFTHIHLHSKAHGHFKQGGPKKESGRLSRNGLLGLLDNLESTIKPLRLKVKKTTWGDYTSEFSYNDKNYHEKKQIVLKLIRISNPKTVWDLGANTGDFSRLAEAEKIFTLSADIDPLAVERNYQFCKEKGLLDNILPFLSDLTNPSPGIGWANRERLSLADRGPADTVLALALIHHLVLTSNIPLQKVAAFLAEICQNLIIEFPAEDDSQVLRLKSHLKNIFHEYSQKAFEQKFGEFFRIREVVELSNINRTIYFMEKRV